ncbi:uncharacterized protein F4822DRAFT_409980 [Hypoxylon trugodes]|uniref:uncharacterized protein n=1 Tax=Hypoxylon trugodes TaxID=326681 RepID=UPI00219C47F4|nr:uncharacterized protein F4822DRAFT_409980 [Hypoxylon trugodes]KAI1386406.1 hypothetical protein F4822DRAFT_409980 [Hypoxylon trugodes]
MLFSSRTLVSGAAALLALFNVVVASPQGGPISGLSDPATIPGHCSTTMDDFEHTTAWVKTHECYTYTRTVQSAACPVPTCPSPDPDQICPEYIKVSKVTVPCSTDCCPTTSTTYVSDGPCSTCDPCHIPTQWITYTTGCAGTPTITSETIVTPP